MESTTKFILHCLKLIPEDVIKRIENHPPVPCYFCNEQICSNPLKSFIILPSFHQSCLEEHTLVTKTNYPICGKDFNDTETAEDSFGDNLS